MLEKGVRLSKHASSLALFIGHYSDVGGPRFFVPNFLISPLKFVFLFPLPFFISFFFLFSSKNKMTQRILGHMKITNNVNSDISLFFSEKKEKKKNMIYSPSSKSKFLM